MADVKSKYVNGNLVFYDTYEHRWVDAIGPQVRKWELGISTSAETSDKTITATGTSPITNAVTAGDRMLITTDSADFAGDNIQWLGSPFVLATGKPCYWGARLSISDATQSDLLVGLCEVDTALMAASSSHALAVTDDGAFFYKLDGGTGIYAVSELGGAESSTAAGTMDTSKHWYEMLYDGDTLSTYYDGTLVSQVAAASIPDQPLRPSICFRAGEAGAKTCLVEIFKVIQLP